MAIWLHFAEAVRVKSRASATHAATAVTITVVDAHDGSETVLHLFPDGPSIDLLGQIIEQATAARDALAARPAPALAAE